MSDLPDNTRSTAVNSSVVVDTNVEVRPKGGVINTGSVTSTASYATVATRTITNLKQFQLSKIMISTTKAIWAKYRWNGSDISAERYLSDGALLLEHFPLDYYAMVGNGAKAFDVQIKWGTEAGTVTCEIVGEEYTP